MTFKDQTFRLLPDGTTQNEDTIMSRHISPYEIYAKHVLETMYPERYGTLLLRDKPDLQTEDGAAGIEVTSVNGEIFERLVSEIAVSQPYQAPSDRVLELWPSAASSTIIGRPSSSSPSRRRGSWSPFAGSCKS